MEQHDKDNTRFVSELEGLDRALQAEPFELARKCEADDKKLMARKGKRNRTMEACELTGISNLTKGYQRAGTWALKPLTKAVRKVGVVQS